MVVPFPLPVPGSGRRFAASERYKSPPKLSGRLWMKLRKMGETRKKLLCNRNFCAIIRGNEW